MRAIITRGLYIYNPIINFVALIQNWKQGQDKPFIQPSNLSSSLVFSEYSVLMYD